MSAGRTLARLVDTALDLSVVVGFSRVGPAVRQRLAGWPPDVEPGTLRGKRVVVTGASSGLGLATAEQVVALGGRVDLLVRDIAKGQQAAGRIGPGKAEVWRCDLADPDSIAAFIGKYRSAGHRVHGLVHNAGTLPGQRSESPDGHELTMAVHVLGPIRLTDGLLESLDTDGRIVLVTSGGMYARRLPADDPDYRSGDYAGAAAYARSKRTQVDLLPSLQRRWSPAAVYATHPGWTDSPGLRASLPRFAALAGPLLRTPAAGADTTTWLLGVEPAPAGGGLWHDRRARPTHRLPGTRSTPAEIDRMWQWVLATVRTGQG